MNVGRVVGCAQGKKLNLLGLGSTVMLSVGTWLAGREFDTILFELTTEGDRLHRSGALVQDVDLFEG